MNFLIAEMFAVQFQQHGEGRCEGEREGEGEGEREREGEGESESEGESEGGVEVNRISLTKLSCYYFIYKFRRLAQFNG